MNGFLLWEPFCISTKMGKNYIWGVGQIMLGGFFNDVIVNLSAGDTISLQLFGLVATVVLTGGGSAGASLTIIRLN